MSLMLKAEQRRDEVKSSAVEFARDAFPLSSRRQLLRRKTCRILKQLFRPLHSASPLLVWSSDQPHNRRIFAVVLCQAQGLAQRCAEE